MACGKRVAWPPCGTRSPTKHCKIERRRTREVQRDGAETYIVFRCSRLRYDTRVCSGRRTNGAWVINGAWGCSKAVEVSALSAIGRTRGRPRTMPRARFPGSSVRHFRIPIDPIRGHGVCLVARRSLFSTLVRRPADGGDTGTLFVVTGHSDSDSHRHAACRPRRVRSWVRYPLGSLTL